MTEKTFTDKRGDGIVTVVIVRYNERFAHLTVYNRGQKSGILSVAAEDALVIANRLIPPEYQV